VLITMLARFIVTIKIMLTLDWVIQLEECFCLLYLYY
jgi:hypothetical protein